MTYDELERFKVEADRWIACVTGNGSCSGPASNGVRDIIQQVHDKAASPSEAEERVPQINASGSEKLYVGHFAAKWLTVHVDPSLPDDVIEIRAPHSDHVLGRIVNVALADHSPFAPEGKE